ncbi:hypothetical protein L2E82_33062 [Cichorium intybus]|uniref:Uncharacterized protein n=1 Tax=Cichorium intybus TaxID=13427 RepID=A0ACB9BJ61_CICIN|nr:hypothetical protein L2E82_33062 [Cichorium intybus]
MFNSGAGDTFIFQTRKMTSAGMYFLHFQVYRMDSSVNAKAGRAARFGTKGHALTFLSSAGYSNVLNQVCTVFGFRSFFYVLVTLLHHMLLFQFVAGLTMEPALDELKQILQVCTGARELVATTQSNFNTYYPNGLPGSGTGVGGGCGIDTRVMETVGGGGRHNTKPYDWLYMRGSRRR